MAHHENVFRDGINDFVLCLGYKGFKIKEYFIDYGLHNVDITVNTRGGVEVHHEVADDWHITLAETGEETMTGGGYAVSAVICGIMTYSA